ncbi:MAG: NUDIX domain-containing protein [Bacteroidetes bacterium]|nr:NUDIX domain-containing protein [Bacteroidota bacterium]
MEKIIAAGGLILNKKNELLMIFRRGKWDLPKGKLDDGESIPACALREVHEETGLKSFNIVHFLGITYHEYFNEYTRKDTLKETHWYKMQITEDEIPIPQTEEQIEKIEWVAKKNVAEKLTNSYKNIEEIISKLDH